MAKQKNDADPEMLRIAAKSFRDNDGPTCEAMRWMGRLQGVLGEQGLTLSNVPAEFDMFPGIVGRLQRTLYSRDEGLQLVKEAIGNPALMATLAGIYDKCLPLAMPEGTVTSTAAQPPHQHVSGFALRHA